MEYIPITTMNPKTSAEIRHAFTDNMDKEYTLFCTDYRDNYDESRELIQKCLDAKNVEALTENHWEADSRRTGSEYVLESLKDQILSDCKYKRLHPYLEDWLEDNRDEMLEIIEDRDTSDPYKEILGRSKIYGRATLFTNYDCFPHNYDMDNTYYYDEYLEVF